MSRVLKPGLVIGDKYRIARMLGAGGIGRVVAATHVQLGVPVALKFLQDQHVEHPDLVERFLREARTAAVLRGEHVCRVTDVGTASGQPFMVMELLEGSDLAKVLSRAGKLPATHACEYVLQACHGVAEAHAHGIVHRDLKPSNLFLTKRPDGSELIKVLDFGVAKLVHDGPRMTLTNDHIGSPGYMSPEQIRSSRDVDPRSDIWSLGVILFELIAGHLPFHASNAQELAVRIVLDPTPSCPGVQANLDALISTCLQKDPDDRFQTVAALARALGHFVDAESRDAASSIEEVLAVNDDSETRRRPVVEAPTLAPPSRTVVDSRVRNEQVGAAKRRARRDDDR